MPLPKIQLRNICLKLGDKQVFENFNLEVAAKEKVLLRGPSGSGKSTLLRMILGFVRPDTGEIRIDGKLLDQENVWAFRRRMAFVSQGLNIGAGRVNDFLKDILFYRANNHLTYDEDKILAFFEAFRLEKEKLKQEIGNLSGGEKQRVALIATLLLEREVYLLDEVTSAIDEQLRDRVIGYLAGMEAKTLIMVSHDQGWEGKGFRVVEL